MLKTERLERESSFHDKRFGQSDNDRAAAQKYYQTNRHATNRYVELVSQVCHGKELLEYGCGTGNNSQQWLERGARLTGIDISAAGIQVAKEKMAQSTHDASYYVMDAENTEFDNDRFDVVVGTGILHHLDLTSCYQELSRICQPDGHAIFLEPLGHNPLINLYRLLTPKMRTVDEHPMKSTDLKLLEKYFNKVECEYFALCTLFTVPLRNMPFYRTIHGVSRAMDRTLLSIPLFKRYAWMVVIHASEPKKGH